MLKKISELLGKYMAIIVLVIAALALFVPKTCLWIQTSWVNYLLMVVMFGMGLTLKPRDFAVVFTRPKDVLIGCIAQFTIMPLLAFALGKVFGLEAGLLAGVILVGTCPGGTSSNVMTYLSKGDVALSVGMTSINTLLAPFLTPAITYLLLRTSVNVDVMSMFFSIIKVVIVPIALGFIINHFFGKTVSVILFMEIRYDPLILFLERADNISAVICRIIIYNNHFKILICLRKNTLQTFSKEFTVIVGCKYY